MLKAIGSKKNLTELTYYLYVEDLLKNEQVMKLADYKHHIHTTRLQHSINVSYYNYLLCKFFKLDVRAGARAGLLHDLFFYDRHDYVRKNDEKHRRYCFHHASTAFENADSMFEISPVEKDIILKHMWPMTIALPKYRETFIITLVDKYCAVLEFFFSKKAKA